MTEYAWRRVYTSRDAMLDKLAAFAVAAAGRYLPHDVRYGIAEEAMKLIEARAAEQVP